METSPINALPLPAMPAGADGASQAGAAAPQESGFQSLMARQLEALVPGAAQDETPIATAADDEEAVAQECAPDLGAGGGTAAETTLSLLAMLPQAAPRTDAPAAHGTAFAPGGAAAGQPPVAEAAFTPGAQAVPLRSTPERPEPLTTTGGDGGDSAPAAARLPEVTPADLPPAVQPVPLAAPSAAEAGPPRATAVAPPRIDIPLGLPGWSNELAHRVALIANDKQQVAELHINPPHLGPVDITLTISDDQASAVFASSHAIVRETLESALPRLREVLAESGIQLGQATVTADSPRDGQAFAQPRPSALARAWAAGPDGGPGAGNGHAVPARRAMGLVDLFA